MSSTNIRSSSLGSRLADLIVLTVSFLLFELITDLKSFNQLLLDLLVYVPALFVCLRLSKRVMFNYIRSSNRMINVLLGNISGLVLGGLLVALFASIFPDLHINLIVVIFASIMAFFVLGTLSPMVKSSHRDIIHH